MNEVEPVNEIRVIACPHVFSTEKGRIDTLRPAGATVLDVMRSIGWPWAHESVRVTIDGVQVHQAQWEHIVTRAGESVVVRAVPMGGGDGGKDIARIVAMVAIIALAVSMPGLVGLLGVGAALFAGTTAGALALTIGTSIIGTLAINALIPPANQKMDELSGQTNSSNTLSLNGTSNQLIPYGVVPRVYGRHRIFPPLAARHYTEVVGDQQFIRALFCFGPGPLSLSDFKIGENLVELFQDVEIEVHQGYPTDPPHTLYPAAVNEEPLSIPLKNTISHIRTSKDSATELSVDIAFAGLWTEHKEGPLPTTAEFNVQYRLQGATAWTLANGHVAVQATLTTAFTGTHNDVIFTEPGYGSFAGNNYSVAFVEQLGAGPAVGPITAQPAGNQESFVIGIRRLGGLFPSAAQVLGYLRGASVAVLRNSRKTAVPFTSILAVALAPGNDGSGRVTVMAPTHLSGGRTLTPSMDIRSNQTTQFRKSLAWVVPASGTYEIQVTKIPSGADDPQIHDTAFWVALRSVRGGVRLIPVGMASAAVRIRATDQLHGTLDAFNCMAQSILPDWDGSNWVERETSNPASIDRDLHQGTANARPKADGRMDLVTLQAFHERCTLHGFEFNAIIDFRSTLEELSRDVLAAGRATPAYREAEVSCTEDVPQTIPAWVFTPRNSWDLKVSRMFTDVPHALKVRFANAETLEQDERVVIADGYGVTGADGIRRDAFGLPTTLPEATRFESVEAGLGVNNPDQIFKLQRYHLAVMSLRPETYRLSCDFEHLTMQPGDLVHLHHDVPLFGLISGRIKAMTMDTLARATSVTLDEPCVMQGGERYGVRLRLQDGTQIQREVLNVPGEQTTLTFLEPV